MPHPYTEFEAIPVWTPIEGAVRELAENRDLTLTTASSYVVGFLCRRVAETGVLSAHAQVISPSPMKGAIGQEVPSHWRKHVREYIRARSGESREHLLAHDFHPGRSVRLGFPDGSYVLFRYAFYIRNEEAGELAVFTEHCGYHVFPAAEVDVEVLESVWDEPASE
jgi:hypothetical protein